MIAGLPCSGKTFLGKKLLKERENSLLVDDPKDFSEISKYTDKVDNIIITDLNLCLEDVRDKAVEMIINSTDRDIYFEWFYFENKPEKCFINYTYRKSLGDVRTVANSIMMYSKKYKIPTHTTVIEIWQPTDEQLNDEE